MTPLPSVYIVSAVRTPIGSLRGSLSSLSAVELGSIVIAAALERVPQIKAEDVDEVYMGNVLSANLGQNPARQSALNAGLLPKTVCTSVNKVCASGLKAICIAAKTIMIGHADIVIAGGFESMSNAPYYMLPPSLDKSATSKQLVNGMIKDGLTDAYGKQEHGGLKAEACARSLSIQRAAQDEFTVKSYEKALRAQRNGCFADEIVTVSIKESDGSSDIQVDTDEGIQKHNPVQITCLKPAFLPSKGTITAANSSSLSDGASAVILISAARLEALNIKPMGRILSFADAATHPSRFTVAPAFAIPLALSRAGLDLSDIDVFEINEAFAVSVLANAKLLGIEEEKINVHGGAVTLGHPLGASGARILTTALGVLKRREAVGDVACVAICNGGGGATALIVENLQ